MGTARVEEGAGGAHGEASTSSPRSHRKIQKQEVPRLQGLGNETVTLTACPHFAVSACTLSPRAQPGGHRTPQLMSQLVVTKRVFKREMFGVEMKVLRLVSWAVFFLS